MKELGRRDFAFKKLPLMVAAACVFPGQTVKAFAQETSAPAVVTKEPVNSELECRIDYWHEVDSPLYFENYIAGLLRDDYHPVALRDVVNYFYNDNRVWPKDKNPMVITFDDGRLSQFNIALPILNKYSVQSTFFVMPDYEGDGDPDHHFVNNLQIQAIRFSGREIGCHTFNHPILPDLRIKNPGAWAAQIITSKNRLGEIIGDEVETFAHPYGRNGIDPETVDLVSKTYKAAVTTGGENYILTSENMHLWPRFWRS